MNTAAEILAAVDTIAKKCDD